MSKPLSVFLCLCLFVFALFVCLLVLFVTALIGSLGYDLSTMEPVMARLACCAAANIQKCQISIKPKDRLRLYSNYSHQLALTISSLDTFLLSIHLLLAES